MEFNVNDIEWKTPVSNAHSYSYKGRTYVIAQRGTDLQYVFIAFATDSPKGPVSDGQNLATEDIVEIHGRARLAVDAMIKNEEKLKEANEQQKILLRSEINGRLSDQLAKFGLIEKNGKEMSFTDLGTRTLQFMRLLHGRLGSSVKRTAKPVKKTTLKRVAKTADKKANAVKRPAKTLQLRRSGPIFNHRLATFADFGHAKELASVLSKKGIEATTKETADGRRCHVLVSYSKAHEAVSLLRQFRNQKAG